MTSENFLLNRLWFLLETLRCLDNKLRTLGSKLFVCLGPADQVIKSLAESNKADLVTYERQTEPHNVARDNKVKEILQKMSVKVRLKLMTLPTICEL